MPNVERLASALLQKLSKPTCLAFPGWDAAMNGSRSFQLYCNNACRDGSGATLEHYQSDGSICPIVFFCRGFLSNERDSTILGLEASAIVGAIKHLRSYFCSILFRVSSDHQALERLDKVGKHHLRVQRCLKFPIADQFTPQYCKGAGNNKADFLSRSVVDGTGPDVNGPSYITHD